MEQTHRRRKEKDKGSSSKSNSDVEELEKKSGRESDRKREFDKKSETDRREYQKPGADISKGQFMESEYGMKNVTANNFNQGNAGTRYLDRMRGTFLSFSKAFSGGSFFGRGVLTLLLQ